MVAHVAHLKILIAYQTVYPDYPGGVEHRNHQLATALSERGHDVTLAGWSKTGHRLDGLVHVLSLGPARSIYNQKRTRSTRMTLRFGLDIARLRIDGFDLVETPNMPYVHLPILAAKCRRQRIPLVVTWHEHWGPYWHEYLGAPYWRIYWAIEHLAARLGTTAIAVSELTRTRVAASRRTARTVVVPNGIPFAHLQHYAGTARDPTPRLVFAGRLIQEKRVDLLLRSLSEAARRGIDCTLAVIGSGPEEEVLRRRVSELGLGARVDFKGQMSGASYWSELARSWLAIQASTRDSFGMFPLEAMALGLPVIYCRSDNSALPELVRNGIEGVEVIASPESVARAIGEMLSDAGRLAVFGAAAASRAREYDWEKIAAAIEVEYQAVISLTRKGHAA